METKLETKSIGEMSAAELRKALAEKEKAEKAEMQRQKEEYEKNRDGMICELIARAAFLNKQLKEFKEITFSAIERFKGLADKYGDIRSNSKGGFGLRTKDSKYMVKYDRNAINEFDERADMALSLIKDFLQDTVKKRDQQSYLLISKLLTRNKAGDLNVSRVLQFLEIRDQFDDERWIKAMNLMEESYRDRQISYSISFYEKNETTGKDDLLSLNFTSI